MKITETVLAIFTSFVGFRLGLMRERLNRDDAISARKNDLCWTKRLPSILLLVTLCSCSTRSEQLRFDHKYVETYHEQPPCCFWKGQGPRNGQMVLAAVRSNDAAGKAKVRTLIGPPIVFDGEGLVLGNPDLETRDGIKIIVELVPFEKVYPGPCGEWGAEVKGKLEGMDFEKRIIRVKANPKNWKSTWQL
jgi:hypothetical protein